MLKPSTKARLAILERPQEEPVLHQDWRNLVYLHCKYDAEKLQKRLPPGLFIDTFEGCAYISLIPFTMENLSIPGFLFGLPSLIEVNVRTYVYDQTGTPGIWFFSLDLNSRMGVNMARKDLFVPYYYATIELLQIDSMIHISGVRHTQSPKSISISNIIEPYYSAESEFLEFFLVKRYAFFIWRQLK